MNREKLIYILLILLIVYVGLRVFRLVFPILILAFAAAFIYSRFDADFRAKFNAAITYLKNRIF